VWDYSAVVNVGYVVPDTPLNGRVHSAALFEIVCRADARCQHESAGSQWRRRYVRRRTGVQRGDRYYVHVTVRHSPVWTYVHVPAASLHDMTGNVRINVTLRHVRVTILNVEEQKVLHILCVCVCVCVCCVWCVCVCVCICMCL
jgi:hypothetical protein